MMCFISKEVERKSSAAIFSPTKTKFDLLHFKSTCKKAHERAFKTLKKKKRHLTDDEFSFLLSYSCWDHFVTAEDRVYYYSLDMQCPPLLPALSLQCLLREEQGH